MKLSTTLIWTSLITVAIIVIANIIATEYRIKRERKEKQKDIIAQCPPCPVCAAA